MERGIAIIPGSTARRLAVPQSLPGWSRRSLLGGLAGLVWSLTGSWQGSAQIPRLGGGLPGGAQRAPVRSSQARPDLAADPLPEPSAAAAAAPDPLRFVRRSEWGGVTPAANHRRLGGVRRLTIHHTGADTRALGASDLQTVQRVEGYHRDERGWACIGYHFLIGHDGVIYEGRPLALQGAHVADHNEHNVGISCIGNFDEVLPEAAQLQSLIRLVEAIRQKAALPVGAVFTHRDLNASTCPGDALYAWLQTHYYGPALG